VFDEIPQPVKVLKDTQNRDDPGIMAWDHYRSLMQLGNESPRRFIDRRNPKEARFVENDLLV
jgi:hypothetical protein